eukprot:1690649-Pleurochrysis_carterae.AAC.1
MALWSLSLQQESESCGRSEYRADRLPRLAAACSLSAPHDRCEKSAPSLQDCLELAPATKMRPYTAQRHSTGQIMGLGGRASDTARKGALAET